MAETASADQRSPRLQLVNAAAPQSHSRSQRRKLPEPDASSPHAGGRPAILSESLIEIICHLIGQGIPVKTVCGHIGISTFSFYKWLRLGDRCTREGDDTSVYAQFSHSLARAMARWAISMQARITLAAEKDWRAAAFLLERRLPELWSAKAMVDLEGTLDTNGNAGHVEETRATLRALFDGDAETLELVHELGRRAAVAMFADSQPGA